MLGDSYTGKTSLVLRFAEGYYRESARSATVGAFFITKRMQVHGITCKIQIWDTAGQEQFKPLAPMYYQHAAAAILCYDVTSPQSLRTLKYWLEELHCNVPAGRIVICMAATKMDLLPTHHDTLDAESL
jgi:small GTP-binding protein